MTDAETDWFSYQEAQRDVSAEVHSCGGITTRGPGMAPCRITLIPIQKSVLYSTDSPDAPDLRTVAITENGLVVHARLIDVSSVAGMVELATYVSLHLGV